MIGAGFVGIDNAFGGIIGFYIGLTGKGLN